MFFYENFDMLLSMSSSLLVLSEGLKEAMLLACLVFFLVLGVAVEKGIGNQENDDLELKMQLKLLNKTPIRSIQDEDGHIIACIELYKQPAFDHPLLKNHTIQMRPSSIPKEMINKVDDQFLWFKEASCPEGSVPIQRFQKEHLMMIKNMSRIYNIHASDPNSNIHYASIITATDKSRKYYGAKSHINIRKPKVSFNQTSAATLWIQNGPPNQLNNIQIGWTVHPKLYGEYSPRLYSFWTADSSQKTSCFNLLCPGFVQVTPDKVFGMKLRYSEDATSSLFYIKPLVFKDPQTGNWWLVMYWDSNVRYIWPNTIFTSLKDFASEIAFGGFVYSPPNEPAAPEMGSGHFNLRSTDITCYISNINLIVDGKNTIAEPTDINMKSIADKPNCYTLKYLGYTNAVYRYNMVFGGPVTQNC